MLSPTTARGLLGHLLRGADPPATNQRASPLPVRSSTYSSLQAILADGAGGGGARGGAGGRKIPRDGRGGGRGVSRRSRDRGEVKRSKVGAVRRVT